METQKKTWSDLLKQTVNNLLRDRTQEGPLKNLKILKMNVEERQTFNI